MHKELRARGAEAGRHKIARLMRLNAIRAKRKPSFRKTTDSDHGHKPAPNILERQFRPTKPNTVWAGDITYIPTGEGWLYLAVVLDLYSRRVIGWGMGPRLNRQLALSALQMAAAARPAAGVLHHSDRGVQYASDDYQAALKAAGMTCSMSRRGNCWDNAVVESFFSSLKTELIGDQVYASRAAATAAIFQWIEVFYNRRRRHSSLGYVAPAEYEEMHAAA
jgi:putative transposase